MNKSQDSFNNIMNFLCEKISSPLLKLPGIVKSEAIEIRLRANQAVAVVTAQKTMFVSLQGEICGYFSKNLLVPSPEDISECFKKMCDYSVYSFQEQINDGFITFRGGNRVGIGGSAVMNGGKISNIKNIAFLNIRIAKEIFGCADKIFKNIRGGSLGVLIAGPPASGKTTVLRDLSRLISTDEPKGFPKVAVIDERCEIAACFRGVPQFNVGLSDVLTGFQKDSGMLFALRSLSPNVIICDEIGTEAQAEAVCKCLNSGIKTIASIHAANLEELLMRPQTQKILNSGAFEKIIFPNNFSSENKSSKIYNVRDVYAKGNRDDGSGCGRNFHGN